MIAKRPHVNKAVSDKLFARAVPEVTHAVLANQAAEISEATLVKLIGDSGNDPKLGVLVAERKDLPQELGPSSTPTSQEGKAQEARPIKSGEGNFATPRFACASTRQTARTGNGCRAGPATPRDDIAPRTPACR